jgi:hypothetical protein
MFFLTEDNFIAMPSGDCSLAVKGRAKRLMKANLAGRRKEMCVSLSALCIEKVSPNQIVQISVVSQSKVGRMKLARERAVESDLKIKQETESCDEEF